jgi:NTP pyrophosphatase (non-canonical NTP hydrolase)
MELKELQIRVDDWIKTIGVRYFNELTNLAILNEEVGELSRIFARMYGEQSFKENITEEEQRKRLEDEMADVLWVLVCLANQTGVDLTQAIENNFRKKTKRDTNRHHTNTKL